MKKIIFLFMAMVFTVFTSSLFAIDSTKVGCATSKSQAVEGVEFIKLTPADTLKISAIRPDNPTSLFAWGETGESKVNRKIVGLNGADCRNVKVASTAIG